MGEKIEPNLISRIQDRRGKTIFQVKSRECVGCDNFVNESFLIPKIKNKEKEFLVRRQHIK